MNILVAGFDGERVAKYVSVSLERIFGDSPHIREARSPEQLASILEGDGQTAADLVVIPSKIGEHNLVGVIKVLRDSLSPQWNCGVSPHLLVLSFSPLEVLGFEEVSKEGRVLFATHTVLPRSAFPARADSVNFRKLIVENPVRDS